MLSLLLSLLVLGLFINSNFIMVFSLTVLMVNLLSMYMSGGLVLVTNVMEVDKLGLLLIFLSLWVFMIMVMVSGDVKMGGKSYSVYHKLMLILSIVLVLTFSVSNCIWFFIMFEITVVPTLGLIIGWGYQPERLKALFYMLVYTIVSSLPLLLVLLSSGLVNCSSYMYLYSMGLGSSSLLLFIVLVLSMLVKLPVYFFHLWLPKAHVEAPLAGSIVLAAVLLKLGGYGIFRFMFMFKTLFINSSDKLLILGLLGAAFSSVICTRQVDMKSLIAYSSIAHMGVMLSALSYMSVLGLQGAFLMLISHGLSSSFLFFLAFVNYGVYNSRSSILMSGLLKIWPSLSLMWFLASLMGLGVPPSLNFVAEVMINSSVVLGGLMGAALLSVSLFVGAIYSLYLYTSCNHGLVMLYGKLTSGYKMADLVNSVMHVYPGFALALYLGLFMI